MAELRLNNTASPSNGYLIIDYSAGNGYFTLNKVTGYYSSGNSWDASKNLDNAISFPGGSGTITTLRGGSSSGNGMGFSPSGWVWNISGAPLTWAGSGSGTVSITISSSAGSGSFRGDTFTSTTSANVGYPITTPTVNAPSISSVTRTSAYASFGVANNGGAAITDYRIDLSTSNFGSIVNTIYWDAGTFSGLSANTTYYARAAASNGSYWGYSGVVSFKTSGNAPTISAVSATPSRTSCTIGISVSYDTNATFSSRSVRYGTSTSYGSSTTGTTLSGLRPNTTYYYSVTVTDTQGRTSSAKTGSFTTTGNAPNITSVSTNAGSETCNFTVNVTYDTNASLSSRTIEYGTSTSYGSSTTGTSISGLSPYTQYYFRVTIIDNFNRSDTYTGNFTTSGDSPVINSVNVTPSISTCSFSPNVEYEESVSFASLSITINNQSAQTFTSIPAVVEDLSPDESYNYSLTVTDSKGKTSDAYTGTFTTLSAPPVINNVTFTDVNDHGFTINADVTSQGGLTGATYRFSLSNGKRWSNPQDTNILTLNNLTSNFTYHVKVEVTGPYGDVVTSSTYTVKTLSSDVIYVNDEPCTGYLIRGPILQSTFDFSSGTYNGLILSKEGDSIIVTGTPTSDTTISVPYTFTPESLNQYYTLSILGKLEGIESIGFSGDTEGNLINYSPYSFDIESYRQYLVFEVNQDFISNVTKLNLTFIANIPVDLNIKLAITNTSTPAYMKLSESNFSLLN